MKLLKDIFRLRTVLCFCRSANRKGGKKVGGEKSETHNRRIIYNILKYIRADDRINERTGKYVRIIFYSKIGRRSREN